MKCMPVSACYLYCVTMYFYGTLLYVCPTLPVMLFLLLAVVCVRAAWSGNEFDDKVVSLIFGRCFEMTSSLARSFLEAIVFPPISIEIKRKTDSEHRACTLSTRG